MCSGHVVPTSLREGRRKHRTATAATTTASTTFNTRAAAITFHGAKISGRAGDTRIHTKTSRVGGGQGRVQGGWRHHRRGSC